MRLDRSGPTRDAILTIAHGTVDTLDELPAFLTVIRRGHAPSPELLAEVTRRYQAMGGRSPLGDICRDATAKLGARVGVPAAYAGRLWGPKPAEVVASLAREGAERLFVVPLAQHSARIYVDAVTQVSPPGLEVTGPSNWGSLPELTRAFAASVSSVLEGRAEEDAAKTRVLFSAHSLPLGVLRGGDPYEREFRASVEAVAGALRARLGARMPRHETLFQSQGMSGGEWLGPDVVTTLDRLAKEGVKHVLFAPIGFLADHVEVLYDLDIEARAWAQERGMTYARAPSLNSGEPFLDALVALVARMRA